MVQLSHSYMTSGKTIAFIILTFVVKVMSLLFNILSRLVIAFLPRSKHLLIGLFFIYRTSLCILEDLRVPWTARRSNQSKLKEINTKCSLEGLKLNLQYFGHLMQTANSLEKILLLRKIEGRRRRG